MNEEPDNKPPYVAYTTFKNFLTSLRKNGVVPSRIDKSLMPGHSGSTQSYLINALRFFGLIDKGGTPTGDLQLILAAEPDEKKKIWHRLFNAAYAPILGDLDLSRATLGMLNEKFSQQGLTGDTIRKCESLMAAIAEDAGIPLAPQLKPNTRPSGSRRPRKQKQNGKAENNENEEQDEVILPGAPKPAILLLNAEGTRFVRLQAPATVSKAELNRIQQWLSFQLIIQEE